MKKAIIILLVLVGLTAGASAQSFGGNVSFSQQQFGQWTTFRMNESSVQVGVHRAASYNGFGQRIITEYAVMQNIRCEQFQGMRSGYNWQMVNGQFRWSSYSGQNWWYRYVPAGPRYTVPIRQYFG